MLGVAVIKVGHNPIASTEISSLESVNIHLHIFLEVSCI